MTLGLKFLLWKNRNFSFQKGRYVLSIAITVFLWDCLGKGAVRNYSTNTIMEKNKQREGGGGLRIWNFQGYWRNSKWIFQGLIKDNVEYSGREQEKIMWNFQESWLQVLKFLNGVTQLCGVSWCEALFCLEFSRGK